MIVIEIGDSDLDGSARDAEHKGFAFAVKFISLSYGSCSGSRLVDVRGYLLFWKGNR